MIAEQTRHSTLASVAKTAWDALVIGGGPAGALVSLLLSRAGRSVLLVDAKSFPRQKVCGGCLNGRSLAVLQRLNLSSVLDEADGVVLRNLHWACGRNRVTLPMSQNVAVDRAAFDQALISSGMECGIRFMPSTTAQVLSETGTNHRRVLLNHRGESGIVEAKLVACADGLSQSSLRRLPEFASRVAPSSRIGLASTVADGSPDYRTGTLTMAVSKDGYVGVTRTGRGMLNIAAAIDPRRVAGSRVSQECIRTILRTCDMPVPQQLDEASWTGTPALTRRSRCLAAERLFVVGDSAGYVEPFTGEGMAFAMASAVQLAPLALRAIDSWHHSFPAHWERQLKKEVFGRQWTCRLLKKLLRSPALCGLAITLSRRLPLIPRRIMSRLNNTSRLDQIVNPGVLY